MPKLVITAKAFKDGHTVEVYHKATGKHWGTADAPGTIVSTDELEFRSVPIPVIPEPKPVSDYDKLTSEQKIEAIRELAGITTDQVVKEVKK